jgi:hypothetical protein
LVVKDATKTKIPGYLDGDFESPSQAETLRRLVDVVGIDISDGDKKMVLSLAKTRNALQHWGLKESAPAVETRAADVLDFLMRFLDDQLLENIDGSELDVIEYDLQRVRDGLTGIKAYVKSRMDRLRGELEAEAAQTVPCPDCQQFALVVDGENNKCHFCPRAWGSEELAREYTSEVLGFSWRDLSKGADSPRVECPGCGTETFVLQALVAATPGRPTNICFSCSEKFEHIEPCLHCGLYFVPADEDATVCGSCWSDLIASD